MSVQIEKGIPVPRSSGPLPMVHRELMEVGDSYLVTKVSAVVERNRVNAWRRFNKPGWKFTIRKVGDGARVWRVE